MPPEFSLVIPHFNEEDGAEANARYIINDFDQSDIDYELVLVNNGSIDNTKAILTKMAEQSSRIRVVNIEKNIGYGNGILQGIACATGEFVGFTCSDGQIMPTTILDIYRKVRDEGYDLGKTKRIERHDGLLRFLLSRGYNLLLSLFFFSWIQDVNGYPKIMKRSLFSEMDIISNDWFIDTEIMIKAKKNGLRIIEVPAIFHSRKAGKSQINFITVFEFLKNLLHRYPRLMLNR